MFLLVLIEFELKLERLKNQQDCADGFRENTKMSSSEIRYVFHLRSKVSNIFLLNFEDEMISL